MNLRFSRTILQSALVLAVLLIGFFSIKPLLSNADEPFLQPVNSLDHTHLHGAALDAERGRILLATHHGLFALEDGQLYQMGSRRDDYMGFTMPGNDPDIIYVSGHPPRGGNMGVLKSTDGGETFTQVFSGLDDGPVDFHAMTASSIDADLVYGFFRGKLYRSEDGADNWVIAEADQLPTQGFCWGAPCLSASGTDRAQIFAGTPDGVWVSNDAGEAWQRTSNESTGVAGLGSSPHRTGLLFAHTGSQGIAVSLNGGQSWEPRNTGITLGENEVVFDFIFHPEDTERVFMATTGNQIYTSGDLGLNWEKLL